MGSKVLLRWGRSAYETDDQLALERQQAEVLGYTWVLREERDPPPDLDQVDVLVVNSKVQVDATVLSALRGDLVVATTSGYDHVDLAAAAAHDVAVVRCPLARRDEVVEQALGSLIALMRRLPAFEEAAVAGHWARGDVPALAPLTIRDARVVVVGLGVIGTRIADVLSLLGAEVIGCDPFAELDGVRCMNIDEALPFADAVTLHCSLTPSSQNLLSAERLALLPQHAVVVNTARGHCLDVEAAVDAVRNNRLRGVAVDVFPTEPYPNLAEGASVEGVLFTPHSAGCSNDLGAKVVAGVVAALMAKSAGIALPHRVA